jgi:sugar phosphate isomerase/epimerase
MAAELIAWLDAICMERDAVRPDLQLAIENRSLNHDGTPVQLLDNLDMLRSVAGEWALGITLDLAHAASHGIDLDEAITAVLPNLVNVHISDAHPRATRGGVRSGLLRDHQIPGTGCLPLRDAIDQLTVGSYGGPLTLELSPLSLRAYNPREARRRLAESVATLRSMIAPVSHDTQVASAVRGAAG